MFDIGTYPVARNKLELVFRYGHNVILNDLKIPLTIGNFLNFASQKVDILGIPDFVTMLINFATSMINVEKLVAGSLYLVGAGLLIGGLHGLVVFGMGPHGDQDKKKQAILKIVMGAIFLFLPTSLSIMNVSFFGEGASISYETMGQGTLYDAVKILVQVGGIVWFARGVMLILKPPPSGREKSFKALLYIAAGTCALNFDYFIRVVNFILSDVMDYFKSLI
jgi:hypothetical protein